jgi:photosystem I protein
MGTSVWYFGTISETVLKLGEHLMTAKNAKPTYTFRAGWALLLLAINFLVAAYYFHIIE